MESNHLSRRQWTGNGYAKHVVRTGNLEVALVFDGRM